MNKSILFVLLLVISTTRLSAQVANNACASAVTRAVTVNGCATTTSSLFLTNATGSPASYYGTTYDVWFVTTIPASTPTVTINLSSLGSNANNNPVYIEAFNATTCGAISTATSIATGTKGSGLTLTDLSAQTYYIRVFTTNNPTAGTSASWNFNICIGTTTTAPGNDNCSGATTLTVGGAATSGTLLGATSSGGAVCASSGTADDDVWYSFQPTQTYAVITVSNSSALNASGTMIQVFSSVTNNCASLVSIGCGRNSVTVTGLSTSATYKVRVYSFGTAGAATGAVGGPAPGMTFDIAVSPGASTTGSGSRMNEIFQQTVLSPPNLMNDPWEVTYGPDDFLWITESKGNKVWRVDPATGGKTVILDLSPSGTWFTTAADKAFRIQTDYQFFGPQGGLAGLAIHPEFMTDPLKKFVYISYVHQYITTLAGNTGIIYRNMLARFTYNPSTARLESPVALCDTLPGSNDHNSQRMIIAPYNGTNYLFYAEGDMGAGQYSNTQRPLKAQNVLSYEGKILRFNLIEDGEADLFDRWIPSDNPFNVTTPTPKQSAVWSLGIRNNQGFAYGRINGVDILYGSSHGPFSDDELNVIRRGINYGHPNVIGYNDGNYNNAKAGVSGSILPLISSESDYVTNTIGVANYGEPIYSFYPAPSTPAGTPSTVQFIYTDQSYTSPTYSNPGNALNRNQYWSSEGVCGISLYNNSIIPGWKNSIFMGTLKGGKTMRLKLANNGLSVVLPGSNPSKRDTVNYFRSTNRFRDVAITADGKTIYTVIDKSQTTSGPTTGNPIISACAGCLQKNTFLGYAPDAAALDRSTISNYVDVSAGLVGVCENDNTVTINAANFNNNLWVPLTDTNSNIVGEIYARNRTLNNVTVSTYRASGVRTSLGKKYLARNITITPGTQPGGTVSVRLYITKAEFDALQTADPTNITGIGSLKVLKNNDACTPAVGSLTSVITPTVAELWGVNNNYYVIQFDVTTFSTFYFGASMITLPVELMSFDATLKGNDGLVEWKTAQEFNTSHFVVERSTDGSNFSDVGTVAANGNSSSPLDYSFTDLGITNLPTSVVYYRLRMVDIDNSYKYTKVVAVQLPAITGSIIVNPNPVSAKARVMLGAASDGVANWKLVDNAGRTLMQGLEKVKKGSNQFSIDMSKLSGGLYYLNVKGAGVNNFVKVQKL